jgi:hypothetical protein
MAMGTSVAGGFCDPQGNLTNWLNELAFVPVDFRPDGPKDEWSGDEGCGVQYFSQQGACRLLPAVGVHLPADMKFPEQVTPPPTHTPHTHTTITTTTTDTQAHITQHTMDGNAM